MPFGKRAKGHGLKLITSNTTEGTLYAALGLPFTATPEEIHASFLRICRDHHPDVRDGEESDIFRAAKHAHDLLMDPEKRKVYDESGIDPDLTENQATVKALDLIKHIAEEIFSSGEFDITRDDLIEKIRTTITEDMLEARRQIGCHTTAIKKRQKQKAEMSDRLTAPEFITRTLSGILDDYAEDQNGKLADLQVAIEDFQFALRLLEPCKYRMDEADTMVAIIGRFESRRRPSMRPTVSPLTD